MSFFRFNKNTYIVTLLSFNLISPVFASNYSAEDPLGSFIQQKTGQLAYSYQTTQAPYYFDEESQAQALDLVIKNATNQMPQNHSFGLNAKAALIMNANTGKVIYEKNINSVRSIASISKIMAAMVVLDANLDMNQMITIQSDEIDRLKGTNSRLSIGSTLSRNQLLHLGLMSSENRAIHALGRTYPGGMSAFVAAMNAKSQQLGMYNTRFYEPTGLDSRNVSTAYDLSIMVRAANQYPQIRHLSTSQKGSVYTSNGKLENYINTNALVRGQDSQNLWDISMQKTGYIREAGRSMVFQAQINKEPLVFVVLGASDSQKRLEDVRTLRRVVQQVF